MNTEPTLQIARDGLYQMRCELELSYAALMDCDNRDVRVRLQDALVAVNDAYIVVSQAYANLRKTDELPKVTV